MNPSANKVILFDCDTGSDDAIALMMLLRATLDKQVKTVAITCVDGNTILYNVLRNNLRILKLYNLIGKVPIYRGATGPLLSAGSSDPRSLVEGMHGGDGMGGMPHVAPVFCEGMLDNVETDHAVNAIIRLAKKYKKQLTVVAVGPLTNLALAVRLDPKLPQRIKNLYIMGGTSKSEGNVSPNVEFNFLYDPEAAHIVMQEFLPYCDTYLTDLELTMENPLDFRWIEDEWLGKQRNCKEKFALAVLSTRIAWDQLHHPMEGCTICDAYCMAMVLDPTFASYPEKHFVNVELAGNISRGHLVYNKKGCKFPGFVGPITIYKELNMHKYRVLLKNAVRGSSD